MLTFIGIVFTFTMAAFMLGLYIWAEISHYRKERVRRDALLAKLAATTRGQYTGGGQSINVPTDDALREGIKQFQRARHSEHDSLNNWRIFYMTVFNLTTGELK
jgi:hypothetical protein